MKSTPVDRPWRRLGRERVRQLLHQQGPVRKARELVVQRAALQLDLVGPAIGHVHGGHDPAPDLAVLVAQRRAVVEPPSARRPRAATTRHSMVVSSPWRPRSMAASQAARSAGSRVGSGSFPIACSRVDPVDVRPALVDVAALLRVVQQADAHRRGGGERPELLLVVAQVARPAPRLANGAAAKPQEREQKQR